MKQVFSHLPIVSVVSLFTALTTPTADAAIAFWHGVFGSAWEGNENWYDARPPNGNVLPPPSLGDVAIFTDGALSSLVDIRDERQVTKLLFQSQSIDYQLNIMNGGQLTVHDGSIENQGSLNATIVVEEGAKLNLTGATVVKDGQAKVACAGLLSIENSSRIEDQAMKIDVGNGGRVELIDKARAGGMRLDVENGGIVSVLDNADGQKAAVSLDKGAELYLAGALGPKGDGRVRFGTISSTGGTVDLGTNRLEIKENFTSSGVVDMSFNGDKPGFIRVRGITTLAGGKLIVRGNRRIPEGRYILLKSFGKFRGEFTKVIFKDFAKHRTCTIEYHAATRTVILNVE